MEVKFYAYLRDPDFAGCTELEWPPVNTLRELGEQMCARFGQKFRGEFFSPDGSALGERVIVLVNGRRVEFLDGLNTALQPTDTVLVFPIVAGG